MLEEKIHNARTVAIKEIWKTWEGKGNDTGMGEMKKGEQLSKYVCACVGDGEGRGGGGWSLT